MADQGGNSSQTTSTVKGLGKVIYAVAFIMLFTTALYGQSLYYTGGHEKLLDPWDTGYFLPVSYLFLSLPGVAFAAVAWLAYSRPGLNLILLIVAHFIPYLPFVLIGINALYNLVVFLKKNTKKTRDKPAHEPSVDNLAHSV